MSKRFIILKSQSGVIYDVRLDRVEIGVVCVVDVLGRDVKETEILLTDANGENAYARISTNPYSLVLSEEFDIDSVVMVDIFSGGTLVASGKINEKGGDNFAKDLDFGDIETSKYFKSNNDYLTADNLDNLAKQESSFDLPIDEEARYYINKAKKLYGETKESLKSQPQESSFYDKIKEDFELLFAVGEEDLSLNVLVKNSEWKKLVFSDEVYYLGKVKDSEKRSINQVAIATPTVLSLTKTKQTLGSKAKFIKTSVYDEFGYLLLVQNASDGQTN